MRWRGMFGWAVALGVALLVAAACSSQGGSEDGAAAADGEANASNPTATSGRAQQEAAGDDRASGDGIDGDTGAGSDGTDSGTGAGSDAGGENTTNGSAQDDGDGGGTAAGDEEDGPATWPLTGLASDSDDETNRGAVVVKVDAHPRARPQVGLADADLVVEQVVEAGLTRFFAVFHSTLPDVVGPVRSVRTTDNLLLTNLNHPLFATSGGNQTALTELGALAVTHLSSLHPDSRDAFFRGDNWDAPHNLMVRLDDLLDVAPTASGPPQALFSYLDGGTAGNAASDRSGASAPASRPVAGVHLNFGSTESTFVFRNDRWERSQGGTPHVTNDGRLLAPTNLVIQFVAYGRSAADARSPEALLLGEGDSWVLTDGRVTEARWERHDSAAATRFTTPDGDDVQLLPGSTWVVLARIGQAELLSVGG